jgi:hypothetical protein
MYGPDDELLGVRTSITSYTPAATNLYNTSLKYLILHSGHDDHDSVPAARANRKTSLWNDPCAKKGATEYYYCIQMARACT